jgi:hypothetical protein
LSSKKSFDLFSVFAERNKTNTFLSLDITFFPPFSQEPNKVQSLDPNPSKTYQITQAPRIKQPKYSTTTKKKKKKMKKKERKRRDSNKFTNFLQYPPKKSHFKSQKPRNKTTSQKTKPMETENRKQRKTEHNKTNLVESRARRSIGGTVLSIKAFSKNFHRIGTLLSQQM